MISSAVLRAIRDTVGSSRFLDSQEDRLVYASDATPLLKQLPDAVVMPKSAEEIAQLLRLANQEGFRVVPRGSGTGLSGGAVPVENCIVLLMTGWDKILEFDAANRCAWVEPGVITGIFQAEAERHGLFYPPDPASAAICTLGGNVAENAGGLRGLKYGVTKNYVIGLEVVMPDGEIVKLGGKAIKDVAGYNLKDLMVGSEGTLGVFTKILLKLLPKPRFTMTIRAAFTSFDAMLEAIRQIHLAPVTPCLFEFMDKITLRCVQNYIDCGLDSDWHGLLLIELDGEPPTVNEHAQILHKILKECGVAHCLTSCMPEEALPLKSARKAAFSALARIKPTTILEDITVPPSEIGRMMRFIHELTQKEHLHFGNFGHAGDGNLHPTCMTDERDAGQIKAAMQAFDAIFKKAIRLGGTITGEHGVGLAKKEYLPQQIGRAGMDLMQKIKTALDPNQVLNPGKMFSFKPKCEGKFGDSLLISRQMK